MRVTIKFDDGVNVQVREFVDVLEVAEDMATNGQYALGVTFRNADG